MIRSRSHKLLERAIPAVSGVLTQSLYAAFIAAGIVSAIVSSIAEFEVVSAFYQKHAVIGVTLFAICVVAVLEIAKLFLVFFNRQYGGTNDEKYVAVRPIFTAIRWSLVTISVLCMLLYTLYSLSSPEYDNELAGATAALRTDRDRAVAQIDSSFRVRKEQRLAQDSAVVQLWRDKMLFETNNTVGRTWEGRSFRSHKQNFDSARQQLTDNQLALETERLTAVHRADSALSVDIASKKSVLMTSSVSQNQMLAKALHLVNGSADYNNRQYTLAVILISLVLSITLESTIWAVFTALAVTYGDAFSASLRAGTRVDEYSAVGRTKARMDREDSNRFYDKVRREKEQINQSVDDEIDALYSKPR